MITTNTTLALVAFTAAAAVYAPAPRCALAAIRLRDGEAKLNAEEILGWLGKYEQPEFEPAGLPEMWENFLTDEEAFHILPLPTREKEEYLWTYPGGGGDDEYEEYSFGGGKSSIDVHLSHGEGRLSFSPLGEQTTNDRLQAAIEAVKALRSIDTEDQRKLVDELEILLEESLRIWNAA